MSITFSLITELIGVISDAISIITAIVTVLQAARAAIRRIRARRQRRTSRRGKARRVYHRGADPPGPIRASRSDILSGWLVFPSS